ncbi:MAG: DUF305 domain-containing protein [Microbacteriaceae bacterium]
MTTHSITKTAVLLVATLATLKLMIEHHEGALPMVMMIENSANEEAQALAREVIAAQTAEIEEMRLVLAGLTSA